MPALHPPSVLRGAGLPAAAAVPSGAGSVLSAAAAGAAPDAGRRARWTHPADPDELAHPVDPGVLAHSVGPDELAHTVAPLHPTRGTRLPWELDDPDEPTPRLTTSDATDGEAAPSEGEAGGSAGRHAQHAAGTDDARHHHESLADPAGEFSDPAGGERRAGAVDADTERAAHQAYLPTDDLGTSADPGSPPGGRPSRFRVGVGAALVLVIVALVCAVLVSMFAGRGRTEIVAPGAGTAGAPSATSAASADGTALPQSGSGGALPPSPPTPAPPGPAATPSASPAGGLILLHVLGAVARPGLYELHAGDRVVDAVAAAGGFAPDADQTQQNLARPVSDGEQLIIPEQGAAPPLGSAAAGTAGLTPGVGSGGAGAAAGSGSAAGSSGGAGQPAALVNLNTADQALLETLPQVGPALAQRIIAWRTTNGRFTQLDDLKNVTGIGDKTFAALQPLVTL